MRDFNFFEPYLYSVKSRNYGKIFSFMLIALFVASLAGWFYFNTMTLDRLEGEIQQTAEEIEDLQEKGYLKRKKELNDHNAELEKKIVAAGLFTLSNDMTYVITNERIRELVDLVPRDLYLNQISMHERTIRLNGFAYDRSNIAEYEYALRTSGGYDGMHVSVIADTSETEARIFNFDISFQVKGVE